MDLTQESVLTFLLNEGGQVKNSELLNHFKSLFNVGNPDERKQNRELFKRFVNNVAVVKDDDGVKYVVVRKKYLPFVKEVSEVPAQHSDLSGSSECLSNLSSDIGGDQSREGEAGKIFRSDLHNNNLAAFPNAADSVLGEKSIDNAFNANTSATLIGRRSSDTENIGVIDVEEGKPLCTTQAVSAEETVEFKEPTVPGDLKRLVDKKGNASIFAIVAVPDIPTSQSQPSHTCDNKVESMLLKYNQDGTYNKGATAQGAQRTAQKPYMLPLRCPPPEVGFKKQVEEQVVLLPKEDKEKALVKLQAERDAYMSPRIKRRQIEEAASASSPHLKRISKTLKQGEEPRYSDMVPLDPVEHEWLVKAAAGHWNQIYGLLLRDTNLAEKKDFMSGFTALHWAAKSGNIDMVTKIIDVSSRRNTKLDVNSKTYGGYTPLHIAALHGHEDVLSMLVLDYQAKSNIRDYSGKKPYHYLSKGASFQVRQLLGDPQTLQQQSAPLKKPTKVSHSILSSTNSFLGVLSEDGHVPELPKGFKPPSLSKLFNPPTVYKKKSKPRSNFASVSEEHDDEKEDIVKRRPISEFFL
ncbi:ankyrin repeat domain-containing protein SOWAHA-like [Acipenser ruthenus]|uniref:ankyrin repeat domain-containing protein SOWAHA-like n=1 Tax=Acipenser ruthenus TaxID=7906 RepID=UPI00145C0D9E|nr:ankyrin repeat domain-containing protein SOWAHA-like [Acipenser ruthenus]